MSEVTTQNGALSFLLAEKKSILVVSLVGPLLKSNVGVLENCIAEVAKRQAKWVIVNFKDVPASIDHTVLPSLAKLQKVIRTKPAELRISALHPDLKKNLDELGLIRSHEISDNLNQALQLVVQSLQRTVA